MFEEKWIYKHLELWKNASITLLTRHHGNGKFTLLNYSLLFPCMWEELHLAQIMGDHMFSQEKVPFLGCLICPEKATLPRHWRFTNLWKDPFEFLGPITKLPDVNAEVVISRSWSNGKWMPTFGLLNASSTVKLNLLGTLQFSNLHKIELPLKWWNSWALDKHVLSTLISKLGRLRHL